MSCCMAGGFLYANRLCASYVMPAILYGSKALCLKERKMRILRWTGRFMVRTMCGVQLRDRDIHGEGNEWSTAQG